MGPKNVIVINLLMDIGANKSLGFSLIAWLIIRLFHLRIVPNAFSHEVPALCFYLSFSLFQSTICTHMMMLTIHTFKAIITADNYMDETFFHCNRISSPASSSFIRKHTFRIAQEKASEQKSANDTTGDRKQNLFMISRCIGDDNKWTFHFNLLRCTSY